MLQRMFCYTPDVTFVAQPAPSQHRGPAYIAVQNKKFTQIHGKTRKQHHNSSRRPCNVYWHVMASYKSSFYYYYYLVRHKIDREKVKTCQRLVHIPAWLHPDYRQQSHVCTPATSHALSQLLSLYYFKIWLTYDSVYMTADLPQCQCVKCAFIWQHTLL